MKKQLTWSSAALLIGLGLALSGCDADASDAMGAAEANAGGSGGGNLSGEDWMNAGAGGAGGGGAAIADPSGPDANPAEGDSFEAVGTNPFVMADSDPQSTFAVDVDTASYDIFRRDVLKGLLPQPESVRLEEFVNFFDYAYEEPPADAPEPFDITVDAAASPFTPTTILRVGIKGKAAPLDDAYEGANIVFLIDVSGSMSSGAKLPLVKTLLTEAVDTLEPTDRVAIVTYASGTGVALPSTPVSEGQTIKDAIAGFSAGGGTAGSAGLALAYQEAKAGFIEGGVNHIILCSDGDFNIGTSGTSGLLDEIREHRKSGVTMTVLGFGSGNLNDSMFEAVSNAGNGTYAFIADNDQAISFAHDRLLSSIHLIAQDVKIQVDFNPETVLAYRQLGYENRQLEDWQFYDDTTDAGEVGAGHSVTALYEVVLAGGTIPAPEGAPEPLESEVWDGELTVAPDELVRVKIRYKEVGAEESDPSEEISAGLTVAAAGGAFEDAPGDLQWAASIAAFAEILKESPFADAGNLEVIESVVSAHMGKDADRVEFSTLLETAIGLLPAEL